MASGGLEAKITSIFYQALCRSNRAEDLSLLLLVLIVFFLFRLRILGLSARVLLFLLYWLVRLASRFLLRTGLLRIAMLWVATFLI